MKKILVPIDFSDASVNALKVACQLALRFDAGLYLLHVNEMIPYVIPVTEYAYTATAVDIETYNKEKYEHIQQLKKNVLREAPYSNLDITVAVEAGVMVPVVEKSSRRGVCRPDCHGYFGRQWLEGGVDWIQYRTLSFVTHHVLYWSSRKVYRN